MRDPARIDRIFSLIREIWTLDPDYRLGQLLINAMRPAEPHPEIYAFEDVRLEKMLTRFRDEIARAKSPPSP